MSRRCSCGRQLSCPNGLGVTRRTPYTIVEQQACRLIPLRSRIVRSYRAASVQAVPAVGGVGRVLHETPHEHHGRGGDFRDTNAPPDETQPPDDEHGPEHERHGENRVRPSARHR